MDVHTDIQIIHDRNGAQASVVLPYADWLGSRYFPDAFFGSTGEVLKVHRQRGLIESSSLFPASLAKAHQEKS